MNGSEDNRERAMPAQFGFVIIEPLKSTLERNFTESAALVVNQYDFGLMLHLPNVRKQTTEPGNEHDVRTVTFPGCRPGNLVADENPHPLRAKVADNQKLAVSISCCLVDHDQHARPSQNAPGSKVTTSKFSHHRWR